jgi:hypothetical protein
MPTYFKRLRRRLRTAIANLLHPPCQGCGGAPAEVCTVCGRDSWPNWLKLEGMRYCPDCVIGFDSKQAACPCCGSPHWSLLSNVVKQPEQGSAWKRATVVEQKGRMGVVHRMKSWGDVG